MPEAAKWRWARWLLPSLAIVALDLGTKEWVSAAFALGEVRPVTSFFNLVLVHNAGAAFSFLAGAGGWQRWFFIAVTVGVSVAIVWMLRRHHEQALLATALSLVLGGALGNLWDRATLGYVVDFIQVHAGGYYFPAFNIADAAISVGVALLILDSVREGIAARRVDTARR